MAYKEDDQEMEISITQLVKSIFDRIWFVISATVVAGIIGVAYVLWVTPVYESTVSILVRPMTNSTSIENMFSGVSGSGANQISTEIELIKSEYVMQGALEKLDLSKYQDKDGEKYSLKEFTNETLKNKITVNQSTNTRNVDISVKDTSPEFATDYANALAVTFKELLSDLSKESSRAQILTIENQIPESEAALSKAFDDLANFKMDYGTDQMTNKIAVLTKSIAAVQMQKDPLEIQLAQAKEKIKGKDISYTEKDFRITDLIEKYAQSTKELVLYRSIDNEVNEARLYTLENQINNVSKELIAVVDQRERNSSVAKDVCDVLYVQTRLKVLGEVEEIYSRELASYQSIQGELQEKIKDVEVNQQLVLTFKTMLEETRVVESAVEINVSIIDIAKIPERPISPRKMFISCIAAFIGAVLSVIIIVVESLLNNSIKEEDEIKQILGDSIPSLGWIPYLGVKKNKDSVLVNMYDEDYVAERYRLIATNIDYISGGSDRKIQVIVVNSAGIGEGKTTVTANLSLTFAKNSKKVLVIDGDLRRPALERTFGIKRCKNGLTDILIENTPFEECIVKPVEGIANLHMLAAGHSAKNSNILFNSTRFGNFLSEMRKIYDYILIDCPPMSFGSDFSILAKHIDAYILNVRAGFTTREQVADISKNIDFIPAPVIGYIFYGLTEKFHTYGNYGYGYSYGYGDGKRKHHKKLNYRKLMREEMSKRQSETHKYGAVAAQLAFVNGMANAFGNLSEDEVMKSVICAEQKMGGGDR